MGAKKRFAFCLGIRRPRIYISTGLIAKLSEKEIEADKFAVYKTGNQHDLISALKKLLAFPTVEMAAAASIADQNTLEPRIHALLKKNYTRRQFQIRHLLVTLFSASLLGVTLITPVYAKEIHHDEHDVMMFCSAGGECMQSCTSQENLNKLYSEIPATQKTHIENASHTYTPAQ